MLAVIARPALPPGPFAGSEAYSFSPDGKELAYTAKDQGITAVAFRAQRGFGGIGE